MAMNPDFTKLNLEEHPHCSYDEWKAELEKTTGKNYDALYENTMERIPVGPLYGKDVYDQCNHLDYMSGIPPFLRGPYSTMYVYQTHGQYVNMQASPLQKNQMLSIAVTWRQGKKVCLSHLTLQLTAVMTPIIRALSVT
ncbi:MAG: methylmalonyl-CoA mutase family protein [Dialister invisus]